MRWVGTAAVIELAVTSFLLLVAPALLAGLVLGVDLAPPGLALARFAGIALLGLTLACWPDPDAFAVSRAMTAYNALAAGYLAWIGIEGTLGGMLLWPAAILHAALSVLLLRAQQPDPWPETIGDEFG